ncbi:hypothetical protein BGE01nite_00620 [Brevifollis gellanilyticus]|uniref:Uncharacterized protein n=1 Tax=Brevifollis gellanilyticus TaxID=748831 RepID=A0A512M380_9BACT|nr:hypothetical protein BGE01nite_00620 [Brevifollis gellanilyticus]
MGMGGVLCEFWPVVVVGTVVVQARDFYQGVTPGGGVDWRWVPTFTEKDGTPLGFGMKGECRVDNPGEHSLKLGTPGL